MGCEVKIYTHKDVADNMRQLASYYANQAILAEYASLGQADIECRVSACVFVWSEAKSYDPLWTKDIIYRRKP